NRPHAAPGPIARRAPAPPASRAHAGHTRPVVRPRVLRGARGAPAGKMTPQTGRGGLSLR
ncbi:MAG TPA: hypothetical protein VKG25_05125, partial [Bryobacteraceae bacterium]|nr:hypothetical protein [Bryobacteraceae bacterium]